MRKVTMQDIADELNVSRVTVWKVFNDYPGVSESLRQQVISAAREMGYSKVNKHFEDDKFQDEDDHLTVAVVVSRPESSLFWMNIIHCIAKELHGHDISLLYSYVPSEYNDSFTVPTALLNGKVQGMIVLNVYDETILDMLNNLKLPKVFLDVITSLSFDKINGDLVLLEGRDSVRQITNSIIDKGRTDIGFIGATDYARTNQDRYEGYITAMMTRDININKSNCLTGSIGIHTYKEEITSFLDNLTQLPEAFVCVSDFVASFLLQYLKEKNIRVPEDVAVSGYDGSTEYNDIANFLTTVQVDTIALGKRLVKQLLYKISDPDAPNEVVYVSFDISYGQSTDFHNEKSL